MHFGTESKIKAPLAALFAEADIRKKLTVALGDNPREQPLPGTNFRSDFAFRTTDGGWLFVEDDDPARSLGNFIKYWLWVERFAVDCNVSLVHLIARCDPGQKCMLEFVQQKAHQALPHFRSEFVFTDDWQAETWLPRMRSAIRRLPPFNY